MTTTTCQGRPATPVRDVPRHYNPVYAAVSPGYAASRDPELWPEREAAGRDGRRESGREQIPDDVRRVVSVVTRLDEPGDVLHLVA